MSTYLVIGKAGSDPRSKNGCVRKNFQGVSSGNGNRGNDPQTPQEFSVADFLTPFPSRILPLLLTSHNR